MRLAAIVSLTIMALLAASAAQTSAARTQPSLLTNLATDSTMG